MIEVLILKIENPDCFWVCIIGGRKFMDNEMEYKTLQTEMNQFYNKHYRCVDAKPCALEEGQWSTPLEAVERFNSGDIWIAPPQLYELCRLCHFSSLDNLERFSSGRALEGCERWMSVHLKASDGRIHLLPGDDLYPKDPDFTGEKKLVLTSNKNIEELMKEVKNLHRIVIRSLTNLSMISSRPEYMDQEIEAPPLFNMHLVHTAHIKKWNFDHPCASAVLKAMTIPADAPVDR